MEDTTFYSHSNYNPNAWNAHDDDIVTMSPEQVDRQCVSTPEDAGEYDETDGSLLRHYQQRIDAIALSLNELRRCIDNDEDAEIWYEIVHSTSAGRSITDARYIKQHVERLEEMLGYLTRDLGV